MLSERERIEASVKERFGRIAIDPYAERKLATGVSSAKQLGYDSSEIDALPASVLDSFVGVGNPLSLGSPKPGSVVLDLGSGAGLDALLAARYVGPFGKVIGVDFSPDMVGKARVNAERVGAGNVVFELAPADRLPVRPESVDFVITNGVFNLCVDKPAVAKEMRRVLKPGGALRMADILLEPHVTPEDVAAKGALSD